LIALPPNFALFHQAQSSQTSQIAEEDTRV
jgi:hypothetical protein